MSKQYNKAEKRQRRQAYLKRRRVRGKAKKQSGVSNPTPVAKVEAAATS
jgi:hypothetical protein